MTVAIAHYNLGRYLPGHARVARGADLPEPRSHRHRRRLDRRRLARSLRVGCPLPAVSVPAAAERRHRRDPQPLPGTRPRRVLHPGRRRQPRPPGHGRRRFVAAHPAQPGPRGDDAATSSPSTWTAPTPRPDRFLYALRPTGGPHVAGGYPQRLRRRQRDLPHRRRSEASAATRPTAARRARTGRLRETGPRRAPARRGAGPPVLLPPPARRLLARHELVRQPPARCCGSSRRRQCLPPAELLSLWTALLGFHQELERRNAARRRDGIGSPTRPRGLGGHGGCSGP